MKLASCNHEVGTRFGVQKTAQETYEICSAATHGASRDEWLTRLLECRTPLGTLDTILLRATVSYPRYHQKHTI